MTTPALPRSGLPTRHAEGSRPQSPRRRRPAASAGATAMVLSRVLALAATAAAVTAGLAVRDGAVSSGHARISVAQPDAGATAIAAAAADARLHGLDCGSCQAVVGALMDIAGNATALAEFVQLLDAGCDLVAPNQTLVCALLANATAAVLPWVQRQLNTLDWPIPAAFCSVFVPVCDNPCCDTAYDPAQVHLALTRVASQLSVTWVTLNQTASLVQYGVAGNGSVVTAAGAPTRTYSDGGWQGVIHSATMAAMQPATTYTYRVGDGTTWSQWFNTTTLPANIATAARPLRLAQIGDMGQEWQSNETIASLQRLALSGAIDLVVHSGDIGYADAWQPRWDAFLNQMQPITAAVPYMVTPGNHELWFNFSAYRHRFTMPDYNATQAMYYSVDVGPAHLAFINTETAIDTADIDDMQRAWLAADLAAAAASSTRIVVGHRPFYCTDGSNSIQCGGFAAWLRGRAESLLVDNHVALVVTSHEHGYERTWPVVNGTVVSQSYTNPGAPTYIVSGAGGNREGNEKPRGDQPWSAFGSAAIGYTLIAVADDTVQVQFVQSSDGTVLDSFAISGGV